MEQTKESFVKGAAILGFAAFISKVLGAVYRIPYQNITGDQGMYVFQQVYPLYSVLIILATSGFPIAISKMVSEKVAKGDLSGVNQIYRISSYLLFLMGCSLFFLLFFSAGIVAKWMGNQEMLTLPIQAVSFALLVVPMMGALRGLFQGYQNMIPTAISQVTEQTVRVATILFASWYCMEWGWGVVYAGAGATLGAFTGAIVGLFILLFYWKKYRYQWEKPKFHKSKKKNTIRVIKKLFILSIPICLGSLTMPLYSLIDSFSVANLLETAGFSLNTSISMKGIYDRGQPLLQFAAFFSTVLSLSIVPAISEAKTKGNSKQLIRLANLALRFTVLLGLPASVGLAIVSAPTNIMLFQDAAGSDSLAILSLGTIFLTLSVTAAGILQGLGRVYLPAIYMLIGVIVKISGNLLLIPILDIRGASIASVIAYFVHACLSMYALYRIESISIDNRFSFLKKYIAVLIGMILVTYGVMMLLQLGSSFLFPTIRLEMMMVAIGSVLAGVLTYSILLLRFGLVTKKDLKSIPKLEKMLLPMLEKWKLIR